MRARVLDGQMGLFDEVDDDAMRTCLECVHVREGGEYERAHGLTFCYLRQNKLAWQHDGDDRPFQASAAQTCPKYLRGDRQSIRAFYNPKDRAAEIYAHLYPGKARCIIFHNIWECCTVAYAQCHGDWYERSKSIRDVAEFMRDGTIESRSMFAACHSLHIFDDGLDYHTCWDRCWAVKQGMPWLEAVMIDEWDYSRKEPRV